MSILSRALCVAAGVVGLISTASAADLPYRKAPVMVSPAYNWSGFYVGAYGGSGYTGSRDINVDPGTPAGNPGFGAAANGGLPIFSTAYNNLANNGIGGVPNTINPGGASCNSLTNACANAPGGEIFQNTFNNNPGYRTDSTIPTSLTAASQMQALYGVEIGYRKQFDRFVLGIGADITGFSRGGTTNVNSTGSFYNSNGATGNSQVLGCIVGEVLNTCTTAQALNTSGSVITVNSGGSALNLAIKSNPNWVGTVRGSAGYAFDRVLLTVSGGFAYADAPLSVTGNYRDNFTSACSGVSNIYTANTNRNQGTPGQSFVNYTCNGNIPNTTSVNRTTTTAVNYSGNRGGGLLTGFSVGSGAAYAISDNISISVESLYYNLGTARATVTGTGTATTTTSTTSIGAAPGGGGTVTTAPTTAALTATPFTVARQIDGFITKAGVQLKF
jgi:opacity protein-like surface antigen